MTIPSQLSGKVFDMVKNIMPKNTLNLELAQLLIADSFAEDESAREYFELSNIALEDHLPAIVETLKEKKSGKGKS